MNAASRNDEISKNTILLLLFNGGDYLCYVDADLIEKYKGEMHIQNVRRYIQELKDESWVELVCGPEGEDATGLTYIGMQRFDKHGNYIQYLKSVEKEISSISRSENRKFWMKVIGAITTISIAAIPVTLSIFPINFHPAPDRLTKAQQSTARGLDSISQELRHMRSQLDSIIRSDTASKGQR